VVQNPGSKGRLFYGYIVAAAALCIMTAAFGTSHAFGVFFNPIVNEFGWTRGVTSGAFSLSMFIQGPLGIVMGGLTDRLGPRMVLRLSGFLLGLGFLLMSRINSLWQLYLVYGVIIGVGLSGIFVPLVSIMARWFVKRRAMMAGIVVSGTSIATLIGPLVADQLISLYEWRTSYTVLGVAVLVIVVSAAQLLRRDPAQVGQVPYGQEDAGKGEKEIAARRYSLKEAAHTRQLWVISAMFFCFGFSIFSILIHIVPHATDLGISSTTSASIMATVGAAGIAGTFVLGHAADKIGNRQAYLIGSILMAAALFWLLQAEMLWPLFIVAAVLGLARGGMGAAQSPLVADFFGLSSHGLIFGVASLFYTTGASVGPLLSGYLFDATGSYHTGFLVAAAISIAGLVLTGFLNSARFKESRGVGV
jgi:MFS family permease